MSLKKVIGPALVVLVVSVCLWKFMFPTPVSVSGKVALASSPAAPAASPGQIAAPRAVPKSQAAGAAATASSTPVAKDPQADLETAIPDIVRIERSGDVTLLYKNYTPPAQFDPRFVQALENNFNSAQAQGRVQPWLDDMEQAAEGYEALEGQKPTFNAAGDEATYHFVAPAVGSRDGYETPWTLVKIDGKWYLKQWAH